VRLKHSNYEGKIWQYCITDNVPSTSRECVRHVVVSRISQFLDLKWYYSQENVIAHVERDKTLSRKVNTDSFLFKATKSS
jgi:hypothetical protein